MPVIVVGADTPLGEAVIPLLSPASGEIRVFVTNPAIGARHRKTAKVAVGDVSDGSHVGGAATGAFCAVLIASCATDERERSFAATSHEIFSQWAEWLADAGLGRIIFVGDAAEIAAAGPLEEAAAEYTTVDTAAGDTAAIAATVARLENLERFGD